MHRLQLPWGAEQLPLAECLQAPGTAHAAVGISHSFNPHDTLTTAATSISQRGTRAPLPSAPEPSAEEGHIGEGSAHQPQRQRTPTQQAWAGRVRAQMLRSPPQWVCSASEDGRLLEGDPAGAAGPAFTTFGDKTFPAGKPEAPEEARARACDSSLCTEKQTWRCWDKDALRPLAVSKLPAGRTPGHQAGKGRRREPRGGLQRRARRTVGPHRVCASGCARTPQLACYIRHRFLFHIRQEI